MKRFTISVADPVAQKVQRAVEAGEAASVSAYFSALVEREPDWESARQIVDEMIAASGAVDEDDRAWARHALDRGVTSTVSDPTLDSVERDLM